MSFDRSSSAGQPQSPSTNVDGSIEAPPAAYDGVYADLKGDVLNVMGKPAEARAAYQQALEKSDAQGAQRNLIQLKLDGLGSAQ